ncbi:MAG: LamG domain-containing protein, partial [Parcubacteria group bacterium Athens0714_24]
VQVTVQTAVVQYTLSVTKSGDGSGTVNFNPPNSSFSLPHSESYSSGQNVILTANAAVGSTFTGWSGGGGGSGWLNRKKITFSNSASTENLINFPALIILNSSRIDYGKTQNSGQDIRFFDSDGTTALPYEIEKWDESGTSYVWVKVPQIDAGSNTDYIWMYYNNTSASDAQNAPAVWDSNFKGVWHLPNGTILSANDSTSNGNNATAITSTVTSGKIDGAASFNGTTRVTLPSINVTTAFTLEAWIYPTAFNTGYDRILTKAWISNANPYQVYSINFTGSGPRYISLVAGSATFRHIMASLTSVTLNQWMHVVGTYDGVAGNLKIYVNGDLDNSTTGKTGTVESNAQPVEIGYNTVFTSGQNFIGTIDEAKISSVARSASWIMAEYKAGIDTFNSYGTEESLPSDCSGTGTCTVNMTEDRNVTASFNLSAPQPDFSLNSSNAIYATIVQGQTTNRSNSTTITVSPLNGFSSNINFSVQSISPAIAYTPNFSNSTLSSSQYASGSTFSITLPASTPAGIYTIVIKGDSGGIVRTVNLTLNVEIFNPNWVEF